MKFLAILGLSFFCYCFWQVNRTWKSRDRVNIAIWTVIIAGGGGICIGMPGRWSWVPLLALMVAAVFVAIRLLIHFFRPK
jgi:hypothetical protein